ncbi:MAG: HD domain-containing protein [Chloroflexota bacterium]|nr:HD domain-containing protein [Chloroflexota bacterium]
MNSTLNYFEIIHAYLPPDSLVYRVYIPHVAAVTTMAIRVGRRLGLEAAQLRFIEEAAMLHDIGIVRVDAPQIGCYGELPYISHLEEGRKILEQEGLPRHARVAAEHVGLGITEEEILAQGLALPPQDLFPQTTEGQVISWADLFFSKTPGKRWYQRTVVEVRQRAARYGERQLETFAVWLERFGT